MTTSDRPRIAVPGMWTNRSHGLRFSGTVVANAVLEAIVRAGGDPYVIFPGSEPETWEFFDALVLPGGSDVDPNRYGAQRGPESIVTDFDGQDDADARSIQAAVELNLPALLICRGMQLWNVERGGSLVQHWPNEPQEHVDSVHPVIVAHDSRLSATLQGARTVDVSSYHHQAIDRLGDGLVSVAHSQDGCIEAVEDPDFEILAVQWHPEDRAESNRADQALFDWVVSSARRGRRDRG